MTRRPGKAPRQIAHAARGATPEGGVDGRASGAPNASGAILGRTEAQVLAQVLDVLRIFGVDVQRTNTGAALNPRGQMVRFGTPGDSDLSGTLPDGRSLRIEVKREGFAPTKLRGEKREHFERQLAKLRRVNELGGVGFWTDDSEELVRVILPLILAGASVEEPGYGPLVIRRKKG